MKAFSKNNCIIWMNKFYLISIILFIHGSYHCRIKIQDNGFPCIQSHTCESFRVSSSHVRQCLNKWDRENHPPPKSNHCLRHENIRLMSIPISSVIQSFIFCFFSLDSNLFSVVEAIFGSIWPIPFIWWSKHFWFNSSCLLWVWVFASYFFYRSSGYLLVIHVMTVKKPQKCSKVFFFLCSSSSIATLPSYHSYVLSINGFEINVNPCVYSFQFKIISCYFHYIAQSLSNHLKSFSLNIE